MVVSSRTVHVGLAIVATMHSVSPVLAFHHDDWDRWLPGCRQSENFWDTARCVTRFSSERCFPPSAPWDLYRCFKEDFANAGLTEPGFHVGFVREVLGVAADCFDGYYDCVVDQTVEAAADLPACVRDSTVALGRCLIGNVGACARDCLQQDWDSPFGDLSVWDLFHCEGIQRGLVQPTCTALSCCDECLPEVLNVMECVVSDVLGFWGDCDFECVTDGRAMRAVPGSRTRSDNDHREDDLRVYTVTESAERIYDACKTKTPGLFGRDRPSEQLAARSDFFDCLVEESLASYVVTSSDPPPVPATPSPTGAPTAKVVPVTTEEPPDGNSGEDVLATPLSAVNEEEPLRSAAENGSSLFWVCFVSGASLVLATSGSVM